MTRKISLQMNAFVPAEKNQPVLDLGGGISEQLNQKTGDFLNRLGKLKLRELAGFRNSDLEEKLKVEIRKFLNIKDKIDNANIGFGFGSYSILERLAWKFLPKGLMVGEFPQFRFFPMEYILAGGDYQGFWSEKFAFPYKDILQSIKRNKKLKVVYINNPNNPTGQVFPMEQILDIIKKSQLKGIFVIIDEVYGDLLPSSLSMAGLVNRFDNLMVARSFSKVFGLQNVRLGYMITGQKIMTRYQDICNWNEVNNLGAVLGLMVLRDRTYLRDLKNEAVELKKETIRFFQERGFEIVPTNPYVPIIFIKSKGPNDLEEYFRKRNIKIDGGGKYRVLVRSFPLNCGRIRVPATKKDLLILKQKLC